MNTLFNINNINTMGMTNPTPISDIRKVATLRIYRG